MYLKFRTKYCPEMSVILIILYIWYKDYQFNRRFNKLEKLLRMSIKFWNKYKK